MTRARESCANPNRHYGSCGSKNSGGCIGSPEYVTAVRDGLPRLRGLIDEHGFNKGAVMFLTGMSADTIDELGGVLDE